MQQRNGFLDYIEKAVSTARAVQRLPAAIDRVGQAADAINQAQLPQQLGETADEAQRTLRIVRYAGVGLLALGALWLGSRALTQGRLTHASANTDRP